jgi:hypothetical protein
MSAEGLVFEDGHQRGPVKSSRPPRAAAIATTTQSPEAESTATGARLARSSVSVLVGSMAATLPDHG